MWHVFADSRTAEDLQLPRPELAVRADGRRAPETVLIAASPDLRAYVAELGERAERVRSGSVPPEEDNMLLISTDGRKAALDMRLVSGRPAPGSSKLDIAADRITQVLARAPRPHLQRPRRADIRDAGGAADRLLRPVHPPPDRAGTPTASCAVSSPPAASPAEQIRWIHEARNDAEKARLFAACRSGQVAVIIGSTQKMGVGTNIQHRAIAVHHLDCPWRPADIEQREGRALRQGNQNPEIAIYRYAVEGSFDSYSWQNRRAQSPVHQSGHARTNR